MLKLIFRVYVNNIIKEHPIPKNLGQIFHEVAIGLIDDEKRRDIARGENWSEHYELEILEILQILAFAMQTRQQTRQTETEIPLFEAITLLNESGFANSDDLLDSAIKAQILIGSEQIIRFSHQLMQEYFTSMALIEKARRVEANTFWNAEDWWEPTNLDETANILIGWHKDWEFVAKWIATANPELAAECLVRNEHSFTDLEEETQTFVKKAIMQKIESASSAIERAAASRALGWFHDNRSGVNIENNNIPNIQWSLPIPPGEFQMGGDPGAFNAWDGLMCSIPYEYFLAKYPITVAQYRSFITDGGYTEKWRHCWTDIGWREKSKWNRDLPYQWKNPVWTVPNQPVVGVTWYEAYAFSNWLHCKLSEANLLSDNKLVVRLPTEAEWEKAARGIDGLLFPWGNEFCPTQANTKEHPENIGRTTAVGLFGDLASSPFGVEDLCGNVWEWCISEWKADYEIEKIFRINTDAPRSSRGGSWAHAANMARLSSRFWYRPGVADMCWGFRVCASIKLSTD